MESSEERTQNYDYVLENWPAQVQGLLTVLRLHELGVVRTPSAPLYYQFTGDIALHARE